MKPVDLEDAETFALLGPGFGGGRALLLRDLQDAGARRPVLVFAPFETPGDCPRSFAPRFDRTVRSRARARDATALGRAPGRWLPAQRGPGARSHRAWRCLPGLSCPAGACRAGERRRARPRGVRARHPSIPGLGAPARRRRVRLGLAGAVLRDAGITRARRADERHGAPAPSRRPDDQRARIAPSWR